MGRDVECPHSLDDLWRAGMPGSVKGEGRGYRDHVVGSRNVRAFLEEACHLRTWNL